MEPTTKRRARIVVINDDTDFLSLMSELLTEVGEYDVEVCREGNHAYQFVKEKQPDLVILDIRMEGQEAGWAILECLTLDPKTHSIPLIVCSAAIRELQAHQELPRPVRHRRADQAVRPRRPAGEDRRGAGSGPARRRLRRPVRGVAGRWPGVRRCPKPPCHCTGTRPRRSARC